MATVQVEENSSHSGSGSRHHAPTRPMDIESPLNNWMTRLESFEDCPPPHVVNVLHLAKNGFYFAPDSYNPEKMVCIGCGNTVNTWHQGDEPFRSHFHKPHCHFVRETPSSEGSGSKSMISIARAVPGVEENRTESTKPLATGAATSMRMEVSQPVPPPSDPYAAQSTVERYVAAQQSQREVPARYAHSMPGNAPELSIVHVKAHDERTGRRTEMTRMQRTGARSERSISPSSLRSQFSYEGAHAGSMYAPSMSSIPLGQSIETRQSIVTQPQQDEYMDLQQRLEHPDDYQEFLDSINTRDASDRLRTFERFWPEDHEFRNIRLLAASGFYCIGQGDAVECFSCHLIIANWTRNDHPPLRHREMYSQCRFLSGQNCGNIPLPVQRAQRGSATRGRSEPPRGRSRLDPPERFHASPYSSISRVSPLPEPHVHSPRRSMQPHEPRGVLPRSSDPYVHDPHRRLQSPEPRGIQPWSPDPRQPRSLQPHTSRSASSQFQPMSLRPASRSPAARGRTSPSHSIISQPSMEQASPSRPAQRFSGAEVTGSNLRQQFPCLNPYSDAMREERARLQTFRNSDFRAANFDLRASDEALARAGLYYFGTPGSVRCWFCGGGLRDFEPNDDPWIEHAKFFPTCEFLLQRRGPAWINTISTLHPHVERPEMPPRPQPQNLRQVVASPHPLPQPPILTQEQREARNRDMLEEGMRSHPAMAALQMGYLEQLIRRVQERKIRVSGCCYQTVDSLIEALENEQPQSPPRPGRQRSHFDSPPGSSRSSERNPEGPPERNVINITGGNFVGQNIINDRVYEGNVPHGQYSSSGGQRSNPSANPGSSGRGQQSNSGSSGRGQGSNPEASGRGQSSNQGSSGRGQGPNPGASGRGQGPNPGASGRGQGSNPGASGRGQGPNPGSGGRGHQQNIIIDPPNLGPLAQGNFNPLDMDEIMENAFAHPFFNGGMDHLFNEPAQLAQPQAQHPNTPYNVSHSYQNPTGGTTTINIRSNVPIGGAALNNPMFGFNPPPRMPQAAPPRPPPPSYATVRPPTPPPLGAINIPRLSRPNPTRSTTTGTATSSTSVATRSAPAATATSTSASSSGPSTSTGQENEVSSAAAQERIAALERERLCKVCLTNEANILFKPCHHITACEGCARQLTVCPVCRARITTYLRTYHS